MRASAGGFFLFDRGVVANGQAGAVVASVDDADALAINPARLLSAGRRLQVDLAFPRLSADFTRTSAGGTAMPTVSASQAPLPTPTIAYSDRFGLDDWAFGVGAFVPSAASVAWPDTVRVVNTTQAAPQRYSLLSMDGTVLASVGAGAAYDVGHGFSVGLTAGAHLGRFSIDTVVTGCDGGICRDFEDPSFDSRVGLTSPVRAAPYFVLGAAYERGALRVGASFSPPYRFHGDMALDTVLPSSILFDGASIVTADGRPPRVGSSLRFPWVLRLGAAYALHTKVTAELDYVVEGWHVQDELRFTPVGVRIELLNGLIPFDLIPIAIPRDMRNTHSIRLGARVAAHERVVVRAGVAYDTGAFGDATLTPLTLDSGKLTCAAGGSVHVGRGIHLDATFAYAFMRDRTVTDSVVRQPTAIEPLDGMPNVIGNGRYAMDAFYAGAGLRWIPEADAD